MLSSVVSLAAADFQFGIGEIGLDEGSIPHMFLHSSLGCITNLGLGGNCAAGAASGLIQSIYAGANDGLDRFYNQEEHLRNIEFLGAIAGYFFSEGNADNVNNAANIARSGFENNALCAGVCVAALVASAAYILYEGNGDPIESLKTIGRGDDALRELLALGVGEALAISSDNFPESTQRVLNSLHSIGEGINIAVTYTDDATGNIVSSTWADLPQDTRDLILGGTVIASIVIPATTAARLTRAPDVDLDLDNPDVNGNAGETYTDWFNNPQTRVDGEAGVNTGGLSFDGIPTAHEAQLGRELADQGLDVYIRGENVPGPDAQINGNWYDMKELTGTGRRSLQTSINSAKKNFTNDGAAGLGLRRSDTRALVDARGNSTWDNPESVRAEFDRLSRNGDLGNVEEVRVITSNGPVIWTRP